MGVADFFKIEEDIILSRSIALAIILFIIANIYDFIVHRINLYCLVRHLDNIDHLIKYKWIDYAKKYVKQSEKIKSEWFYIEIYLFFYFLLG